MPLTVYKMALDRLSSYFKARELRYNGSGPERCECHRFRISLLHVRAPFSRRSLASWYLAVRRSRPDDDISIHGRAQHHFARFSGLD